MHLYISQRALQNRTQRYFSSSLWRAASRLKTKNCLTGLSNPIQAFHSLLTTLMEGVWSLKTNQSYEKYSALCGVLTTGLWKRSKVQWWQHIQCTSGSCFRILSCEPHSCWFPCFTVHHSGISCLWFSRTGSFDFTQLLCKLYTAFDYSLFQVRLVPAS